MTNKEKAERMYPEQTLDVALKNYKQIMRERAEDAEVEMAKMDKAHGVEMGRITADYAGAMEQIRLMERTRLMQFSSAQNRTETLRGLLQTQASEQQAQRRLVYRRYTLGGTIQFFEKRKRPDDRRAYYPITGASIGRRQSPCCGRRSGLANVTDNYRRRGTVDRRNREGVDQRQYDRRGTAFSNGKPVERRQSQCEWINVHQDLREGGDRRMSPTRRFENVSVTKDSRSPSRFGGRRTVNRRASCPPGAEMDRRYRDNRRGPQPVMATISGRRDTVRNTCGPIYEGCERRGFPYLGKTYPAFGRRDCMDRRKVTITP